MKPIATLILGLCPLFLAACSDHPEATHGDAEPHAQHRGEPAQHAEGGHTEGDGRDHSQAEANPNAIAIPESVRQNLGLSFAKAQRRRVAATLRVPGRFELLPSARRAYTAVLPGRVELLVQQYQAVEAGTPLYRIQSPEWLKLRQQLHDDLAAIGRSEAEVMMAKAAESEAQQGVKLLEQRVHALEAAGVRKAELATELASRRNSLPRLKAEVQAKLAEYEAARQRFPLTLASAASVLEVDATTLSESVGAGQEAKPRWSTINAVEVRAAEAGAVESTDLTNGAWAEANTLVLATINPAALRFRGVGLQADLGRLRDGLAATIVPPRGQGGRQDADPLPGTLVVGLAGNPESRTIELVATLQKHAPWARPGVSAFLDVAVDDTEDPEVAIPTAAVIQDELTRIFFRRDPKNPDQLIRTEADLGISDGHWVVVNSGLKAGDEVVIEGVYELKLASSAKGTAAAKGHFHADGSYHEGKDGEAK